MDEYPIKLEEMIACTFNFDNLVKIIQFLNKKNNDLAAIVKNITKKLPQIDKLREEVDAIHTKNTAYEKKFSEVQDSLSSHSSKLLDSESKILTLFSTTDEFRIKQSEQEDKLKLHSTNLNNLNRVVEDHTKIFKAQEEKIGVIQQSIHTVSSKLDKCLVDISLISTSNTYMKETFNDLSADVFKFKDELEMKNVEIEKTITNLISSVSDITNSNTPLSPNSSLGGTNVIDSGISKIVMEEVEKIKAKIEDISQSNNAMNQLIKTNQDANKNELNKITTIINQINQMKTVNKTSTSSSQNVAEPINNKPLSSKQVTEGVAVSEPQSDIHKLIESIKSLNQALTHKANKEEYDTFNHFVISKLEMLNERINENYKNLEGRVKAIHTIKSNTSSSTPAIDLDIVTQTIEKQVIEQLESIIATSIEKFQSQGDLSLNPHIASLINTTTKHSGELDEAYKSIVDIRSRLVSNEILQDLEDIKSRLELNEEDIRRIQIATRELKKNFEGEDEVLNKGALAANLKGNIRNQLIALSQSHKELYDHVLKIEKRNSEMTAEVKDSVKGSLRHETEKVIEQFQKNLNSFTSKFEHQLKNKIDQIGLTSFEYKLNNKFNNEIKEKLDKTDLKKNNFAINRKLDSLENKISKTLVDTIIDLQMDETPLIIKKNSKNIEKCVSCNQILPLQSPSIPYAISNEQHMGHLSNSASLNKLRVSKYNIKENNKLPDLNSNNNINYNNDDM